MIELMEGLPPYVAAFTATGEVTSEDYEKVLMPRIEQVNDSHHHIHFLYVLDTEVGNFTASAWWKDLLMGLQHFRSWKRMAIVTDQASVSKISSALSPLLPGKTKGFSMDELEEAKNWVSQENSL